MSGSDSTNFFQPFFYKNGAPDFNTLYTNFEKQWVNFKQSHPCSLYAAFITPPYEDTISTLMEDFFDEIGTISGKNCCFIYFRQSKTDFTHFSYKEHSIPSQSLLQGLQIPLAKAPCILFFTQLLAGKFVYISLAGLSNKEIIKLLTQIFDRLNKKPDKDPLSVIKGFKNTRSINTTGRSFINNIFSAGKDIFTDMASSTIEKLSKNP